LIEENNDPVHDPVPLRAYMDQWDGVPFIDALDLSSGKTVLEIGVGTGRLAVKVAPRCKRFCGIDLSLKTIERARQNLFDFQNVTLLCGDFLTFTFSEHFDLIYSSLTFMHIKNKSVAIQKAADLLNPSGKFILSIDKNQSEYLDCNGRKLMIYPDRPDEIRSYIVTAGLILEKQAETDFAHLFFAKKAGGH